MGTLLHVLASLYFQFPVGGWVLRFCCIAHFLPLGIRRSLPSVTTLSCHRWKRTLTRVLTVHVIGLLCCSNCVPQQQAWPKQIGHSTAYGKEVNRLGALLHVLASLYVQFPVGSSDFCCIAQFLPLGIGRSLPSVTTLSCHRWKRNANSGF